MTDSLNQEPYVVTAVGYRAAIIQDGENKGLPIAITELIANGTLDRDDVKKRGWVYG